MDKENLNLINAILENSAHAIITTDTEGVISLFNKQAEYMLGYKAAELIGIHTPAIFHKESEVIQRAQEYSREFNVPVQPGFEVFIVKTELGYENNDEWVYVTKDGKEFTVKLKITKLIDPIKKTVIGYMGMAEDITLQKEAQDKITKAQLALNEAQKIAKVGSWTLNLTNNHLTWSDEIYRIFEINKEQFEPSYEGFLNAIHPDDVEMVNESFSRSVEYKEPYNIEHRLKMSDGRIKYVIENGFTNYDENGEAIFSQGTVQDVTQTKKLERSTLRYLELIDTYIITSSTDLNGKITEVSQAFCEISGYTKSELIGYSHNLVRHTDMPKELYKELWSTIKSGKVWRGEIKNKKKDGSHYWVTATISPRFDDNGEKIGYTAIRQDITYRKIMEEISITDGLTNIYNRRHFNDLFPKVINSAKRENELLSFILLDIDHFKQYNDNYGHQMGDDVLIQIANSIKTSLQRADDYCFRLGGEEFGIIFKADSKDKAIKLANKIRKNIENLQIKHSGNSASEFVTASLGIISKKAKDIYSDDELYKDVDDLLYKAKDSGRNKVVSN